MTLSDLYDVLDGVLKDKVAYNAFPVKEAPALPYIVFYATGTDNYAADNVPYFERINVRIELYETSRDFTLEGTLESALTSSGLFWERDDTYIEAEKTYEVIYEVQIYG